MEAIDNGVQADARGLPMAPDWSFINLCVRSISVFVSSIFLILMHFFPQRRHLERYSPLISGLKRIDEGCARLGLPMLVVIIYAN